ncbi:MAG TPA: AraC family transcriptional regulator [Candidatus Angelobacter sp.]
MSISGYLESIVSGMVTTITPQILVGECVRHGISKKKLLDEAGISQDCLDHPAGSISLDLACVLWDTALRLTRKEMLGLHAAERVPFGKYRLLDYMFAANATPKQALLGISRAFGTMNTGFTMSFHLHAEQAYLEMHGPGKLRDLPRSYIEYILAIFVIRLRIVTQVNLSPTEVHVTHGETRFATEYERLFGARVRFRQAVNRLVFPRHLMELQNSSADPELCALLELYAQQKLVRLSGGRHTWGQIREALIYNLLSGKTTLTELSSQLAMSPRSLQREIAGNGMNFRALLDQTRQERALTLLQDKDLPIAEVGARLCYSDLSAFSRAFHRWMGRSPEQYRKNGA